MIIDLMTGKEIVRFGAQYITTFPDGNMAMFDINTEYDPMWGDLNLVYAGF